MAAALSTAIQLSRVLVSSHSPANQSRTVDAASAYLLRPLFVVNGYAGRRIPSIEDLNEDMWITSGLATTQPKSVDSTGCSRESRF
jgi:hypothetical protein